MITKISGGLQSTNPDFDIMVVRIFNQRVREVELYFNFLEKIAGQDNAQLIFVDKNIRNIVPADLDIVTDLETTVEGILHKLRIETPSTDVQTILKSSAVLILYNLIESTVRNCMKAIHEALNKASIPYLQASVPIQKLWLSFKEKQVSKRSNSYLNDLYGMLEVLVKAERIEIPYQTFIDIKGGGEFSGNLDARKMDGIAEKYGFATGLIDKDVREHLRTISDTRNLLAHGNQSFVEWGRDKDMIDMKKYKESVIKFTENFIENVDDYLEPANPKFKR